MQQLDPHAEKIILYPNADTGNEEFIKAIDARKGKRGYHIKRHLARPEYLGFMKECVVLIGNTSSGLMEGGFLKTPFVHVGNRQRNREHGSNVIFTRYDKKAVSAGVRKALSPAFRKQIRKSVSVYRGGAVAERIVREIERFLLRS